MYATHSVACAFTTTLFAVQFTFGYLTRRNEKRTVRACNSENTSRYVHILDYRIIFLIFEKKKIENNKLGFS